MQNIAAFILFKIIGNLDITFFLYTPINLHSFLPWSDSTTL